MIADLRGRTDVCLDTRRRQIKRLHRTLVRAWCLGRGRSPSHSLRRHDREGPPRAGVSVMIKLRGLHTSLVRTRRNEGATWAPQHGPRWVLPPRRNHPSPLQLGQNPFVSLAATNIVRMSFLREDPLESARRRSWSRLAKKIKVSRPGRARQPLLHGSSPT